MRILVIFSAACFGPLFAETLTPVDNSTQHSMKATKVEAQESQPYHRQDLNHIQPSVGPSNTMSTSHNHQPQGDHLPQHEQVNGSLSQGNSNHSISSSNNRNAQHDGNHVLLAPAVTAPVFSAASTSAKVAAVEVKANAHSRSVATTPSTTTSVKGSTPPVSKAAQHHGGYDDDDPYHNQYTAPNNGNPPHGYPGQNYPTNQYPGQNNYPNNNYPNWNNNNNGQGGSSNSRSHFYLRVPPPMQRDPSNCEPYEDMIMEDESCQIHCMLNGRLGAVFLRDQVRRTLRRCAGSQHVCSLCRMNIVTQYGGNATVMGRCHEDCSCRPIGQMDPSQMIEEVKECTVSKQNKFIGSRKDTPDNGTPDFELFLPPDQARNPQTCEPYESLSLAVPAGEPMVEIYQCQSFCAIQGSLGLFHFRSSPRVLHPNTNNACRVPLQTPYTRGLQLNGIFEVLHGYCENGNCVTEAGSSQYPSNNQYPQNNNQYPQNNNQYPQNNNHYPPNNNHYPPNNNQNPYGYLTKGNNTTVMKVTAGPTGTTPKRTMTSAPPVPSPTTTRRPPPTNKSG